MVCLIANRRLLITLNIFFTVSNDSKRHKPNSLYVTVTVYQTGYDIIILIALIIALLIALLALLIALLIIALFHIPGHPIIFR